MSLSKTWKLTCKSCSKIVDIPLRFRDQKFCSRSCSKAGRTGKLNNAWKGGKRTHKQSGRMTVNDGGVYRLEHRVIIEQHLGRRLEDWEVVHHKDEDITNNAIENLEVMSRSEHIALHNRLTGCRATKRDSKGRFVNAR